MAAMDGSDGKPLRLMEQVRRAIRVRHYSRRTEDAYATWIRRYIAFHRMQHPSTLSASHATVAGRVDARRGVRGAHASAGNTVARGGRAPVRCRASAARGARAAHQGH